MYSGGAMITYCYDVYDEWWRKIKSAPYKIKREKLLHAKSNMTTNIIRPEFNI